MDLTEISRRAGIEPRRLRYAIYHALVPGVSRVDVGRGSVRHFTNFEAFCVALAATLFDVGIRREVVASAVYALAGQFGRETPIGDIPLLRMFETHGRTAASILMADGRYFRARAAASPGRRSFDSGWLGGTKGKPPAADYEPTVLVTVDVRALAAAFRGE